MIILFEPNVASTSYSASASRDKQKQTSARCEAGRRQANFARGFQLKQLDGREERSRRSPAWEKRSCARKRWQERLNPWKKGDGIFCRFWRAAGYRCPLRITLFPSPSRVSLLPSLKLFLPTTKEGDSLFLSASPLLCSNLFLPFFFLYVAHVFPAAIHRGRILDLPFICLQQIINFWLKERAAKLIPAYFHVLLWRILHSLWGAQFKRMTI